MPSQHMAQAHIQDNLLEENTELFDLFGEEGFCTICQVNLADGERIRAIQKCQHLYHADCLEPWLRNHTTCPVCRVDVFPPGEDENAYNATLINIWTLIQAQVNRIQTEYHRRILTWTIYDGILHHLPNAVVFNAELANIQRHLYETPIIVNQIEIYHSEVVRNRTQVTRYLRDITREISTMDNLETVRQIRAHYDFQRMRNYVQAYASTREEFRRIWS